MDINNLLDTLPSASDREFITALMEVMAFHCFEGSYRDCLTEARPDRMFQNMLIVMSWVREVSRKPDSDSAEPTE